MRKLAILFVIIFAVVAAFSQEDVKIHCSKVGRTKSF